MISTAHAFLMQNGPAKAAEIARALGVSQPTVSRMIASGRDSIVRAGGSKNSLYAAARAIRQLPSEALPVFRIDESGHAYRVGQLQGVYPEGYLVQFEKPIWPYEKKGKTYFQSLPYSIHDMRPQGYMGRAFARQYAELLGVSDNPERWSDDQVLVVLCLMGHDLPGDMVVGEMAYRKLDIVEHILIAEPAIPEHYFELAEQAASLGVAGSSAGGEFPKFTAVREHAGRTEHVIVKFSGKGDSPAEQRWADLLRCEARATAALEAMDVAAAHNRAFTHRGRTFLESVRFDRVGLRGRRGMCSLGGVDAELVGLGDPEWDRFADKLLAMRLIDRSTASRMRRIWYFGQLIHNTDMHAGNLSFTPLVSGKLGLCPVYDMLPMRFAPLRGGEVPEIQQTRVYKPLPGFEEDYAAASNAARLFWSEAAADRMISPAFRKIAAALLAEIPDRQ